MADQAATHLGIARARSQLLYLCGELWIALAHRFFDSINALFDAVALESLMEPHVPSSTSVTRSRMKLRTRPRLPSRGSRQLTAVYRELPDARVMAAIRQVNSGLCTSRTRRSLSSEQVTDTPIAR